MAIHSTGNLIDALRTFRLISADQYAHLLANIQGKGSDPRPLAKQLVQQGLLTVFQINQLFGDLTPIESVGLAVSDRGPAHDIGVALTEHGAALTMRF